MVELLKEYGNIKDTMMEPVDIPTVFIVLFVFIVLAGLILTKVLNSGKPGIVSSILCILLVAAYVIGVYEESKESIKNIENMEKIIERKIKDNKTTISMNLSKDSITPINEEGDLLVKTEEGYIYLPEILVRLDRKTVLGYELTEEEIQLIELYEIEKLFTIHTSLPETK